jgi:type II secretory pathway pseudopilin PulG
MRNTQAGFTLLELIIAMFMFTAVVVVAAVISLYYFRDYSFSFEEYRALSQTQTVLTSMVREIREARLGDNGAWPIVEASDSSFTFYSDVTGDGRTDRVRYYLSGINLMKGVIEPTAVPVSYPPGNEVVRIVASDVDVGSSPVFTYYNGDWPGDLVNNPIAPALRLLNTRLVKLYVRVNVNPNAGSEPYEMTTSVQIRTLKDNL